MSRQGANEKLFAEWQALCLSQFALCPIQKASCSSSQRNLFNHLKFRKCVRPERSQGGPPQDEHKPR